MNTIASLAAGLRRATTKSLFPVLFAASAVCLAAPAHAGLQYFGGNLAWTQYGSTFNTGYNAATMGGYLSEFEGDHLNFIRVWACENFDGIQFNSAGNCTGISSTVLANVVNFVQQANSRDITVEVVFINYMDVQNRPSVVGNGASALINNALVPLGKALQPYSAQIDLINEGNVATNVAPWGVLRPFCTQAVSALHGAGVNRWITMSDQYAPDFTTYFNSSVGGLGFDFYEFHNYNNDGSLPVTEANVGGARLEMNEFGPDAGWDNEAYATNKTLLGSFLTNVNNAGYLSAAFWSYIGDPNYQLRGSELMGDINWWGTYFGT